MCRWDFLHGALSRNIRLLRAYVDAFAALLIIDWLRRAFNSLPSLGIRSVLESIHFHRGSDLCPLNSNDKTCISLVFGQTFDWTVPTFTMPIDLLEQEQALLFHLRGMAS